MIEKIIIKIGSKKIELTPEELEELKKDVLKVSPEPVYSPVIIEQPITSPSAPWPPSVPYSPQVWCATCTDTTMNGLSYWN